MDPVTNNVLYVVWLENEVGRILEQDASTKSWALVSKSKLPRQCFLWVEDPQKKDTWHLPYREGAGGIDPETGMYRQAGPVNLAALRAVSAAIAGARTGKPMTIPTQIRSKIKKLLKKYKIGEYKESAMRDGEQSIFESSISNQFANVNLDKENCIIRNVAILRPTSSNRISAESKGRRYSQQSRESVARLINGSKFYKNHRSQQELEKTHGVRDVNDLLGYYENGRVEPDGNTVADVHYLRNQKEFLEPIVEQMADKIGLSIDARGDIVFDHESQYENVRDVMKLKSTDLVTETGSTINLFESKQIEEEKMDYDLVSTEELKANRPDIIEALLEESKRTMDKSKELNDLKEKVTSLEAQNKKTEKEKDDLLVEKKAGEKEKKILALIKESKIKEEFVTDAFKESLRNAESDEKIKVLLEDRKKLIETAAEGVTGMGSEQDITEGDLGDWEETMEGAVS